ncbi:VanZ family protein [Caldicellulosiruptoraceae bacterium PP1]
MKQNKRNLLIISWILVFLWMVLIFYLSSQPSVESNNLSKKTTKAIIKIVENKDVKNKNIYIDKKVIHLNDIVRDYAHFFLYLILSILLCNALFLSNKKILYISILSILISLLYSITDEIHQIFVPGRGSQIQDVLIDVSGAFLGAIIYILFINIFKKVKTFYIHKIL